MHKHVLRPHHDHPYNNLQQNSTCNENSTSGTTKPTFTLINKPVSKKNFLTSF